MEAVGVDARETWIRSFIADVEKGHSAMTMQLVTHLQKTNPNEVPASLGVEALQKALSGESSAVGRNRTLRSWLCNHRDKVVLSWLALGFPVPPSFQRQSDVIVSENPEGSSRGAKQAQEQRCISHVGKQSRSFAGVIVFDFDQTLSIRHIGVFEDLSSASAVVDRVFGGKQRLDALRDVLEHAKAKQVLVTLVSRNSKHVVKKALASAGLLPYFADGLIFGFEDYEDSTPKSEIITKRILQACGLSVGDLLFVDDDGENIRDFQEHFHGASAIQPSRGGVTSEELTQIIAWMGKRS